VIDEIEMADTPQSATWFLCFETTVEGVTAITTLKARLTTRTKSPVADPVAYLPDLTPTAPLPPSSLDLPALATAFSKALKECPLKVEDHLITRLLASLLAKRFLIFTGLSGSGKTKLAQAFSRWITPPSPECFAVVPVGADWTSNEHILGYLNKIRRTEPSPAFSTAVFRFNSLVDPILFDAVSLSEAVGAF
jgi:hypothetical protein